MPLFTAINKPQRQAKTIKAATAEQAQQVALGWLIVQKITEEQINKLGCELIV